MDKILELAKPPVIEVPVASVAELQAIDESRERDIELVAEYRLFTAVARISNELISSEEYRKPPIETGKNLIARDENCTDETMTQIAILGTLGIEAFARFNGQHASTIVPSNDKGFWLLNGNLNMHIKHSGKLEPCVSSEMIEATERAIEELQAPY